MAKGKRTGSASGAGPELLPDPRHHVGLVAPSPLLFRGRDVSLVTGQHGLFREGGQPAVSLVSKVWYLRHLAYLLSGLFSISAPLAAYAALGALPEGDLGAPLLGAVGQDAGLQGGYLLLTSLALLR